ncbi:MAG: transcriptional repressor LexA [Candidatus Fonsibacter lacus]|jgi:repressor LexA|uniref:LexA repressor n=2 Tax=Candidatus Fonsibacter lacus TaxID=2576439 RepID=A0A845SEY3_9PROT|nr:transcriptional repressor LexA [Candidatus Fonsibacter lacus]NBP60326.1 transcriptional repressor LexA [Pseudomonadota bacterium]NBQ46697.1 transcriptional repressor LexA [Pseudomonadota bacterium]NBY89959.1 transcriptional repressor LexA [Candidatus Fonsibacter lacus]NCU47414.1 transcriptional repressor LexA [Candidatus Fonsibacter lacus]
MLTKKQKNLLIFINEKLKRTGISPSYDEMRLSLNLKSKSGIHRLISALEERGFIKRLPHKARALEVIKLPENAGAQDLYNNFSPKIIKGGLDLNKIDDEEVFVPVLGKIAAGAPIEALENQTENLPLSKSFLGSNEYFALKVEGDSMIDAGINTGDYVIIKKTNIAESGKIVVALIDDHEATLKRMRKKGPSIALESANPAYETKIYNTERVKIQGVLASLYRKF